MQSFTYIFVNGKHKGSQVGIVFPKRYDNVLKGLMNSTNRYKMGFCKTNDYVFPSRAQDDKCMTSFSAIKRTKQLCGLPSGAKLVTKVYKQTWTDMDPGIMFSEKFHEALCRKWLYEGLKKNNVNGESGETII